MMAARKNGRMPKRARPSNTINNIVVPAILTALSLVLLIAVLNYVKFDLAHGIGASAIIFASFGGSAFLLFMTPNAKAASTKRFVKSYIIGAVLGTIGYALIPFLGIYVVAALVTFAAAVLLIATDSNHPPAMALLFAYILYDVGYAGNVIVVCGVLLLLAIKLYLERYVFIIEKDIEKDVESLRSPKK